MVTAKTQYSLKNAQGYFEEHLCVGDYYEEGQRVTGEWFGKGAQRLGLSGKVLANDFLPLCENKNPRTGERLTQRLKTTRTEEGQSMANRRVFFDFTVSPPKSVSLVAFLGEDHRIFGAHDRAVKAMLGEFEAFAAARIRTAGQHADRFTANFAAAMFTHDTSRALDPHLHTHCIVFNATFDAIEQRWKALQNHELLRARKFAENVYSAVVVSQTWAEVHRVNSLIRDALRAKGWVGPQDWVVQALEKLDLTDAQKRDERFYPTEAVIVFNQKVRDAEPGRKGKLAGIVKIGVLVEVDGRFITVQNRLLDRITVCLSRDVALAEGDRLHLKANRKLTSGARVANGELVTVRSVDGHGRIELADGRVLDASFREFLPGYAVTSYGSQGKTVDYVLFSDSTIKAATNAQQWYVSISRGRRGVRIFTSDKEQLRQNLTRSGHRPLAMDLVTGISQSRYRKVWARLRGYLLRFGRRAADRLVRIKSRRHRDHQPRITNEHETTRMLGERPKRSRSQNPSLS